MYSAPIGGIMYSTGRPICALLFCVAICIATPAQNQSTSHPPTTDKPRVFITDSQSWEMSGSGGGANGAWGAQTHGGARPQTAETIKTRLLMLLGFGVRFEGLAALAVRRL